MLMQTLKNLFENKDTNVLRKKSSKIVQKLLKLVYDTVLNWIGNIFLKGFEDPYNI